MDAIALSRNWQRIGALGLDANAHDVDAFRQRLRFLVALRYGWLAAELFDIEGELGWGPGHRDWEEALFPPPTEDSNAHMRTFLKTLESVRPDEGLEEMLRDAANGLWRNLAGKNLVRVFKARLVRRSGLITYFYGKVAEMHDAYTLGAARIYLALWTQQHKFRLSLAGLVRLLFNPLTAVGVRAETVQRRVGGTFQLLQFFQQVEAAGDEHNVPIELVIKPQTA